MLSNDSIALESSDVVSKSDGGGSTVVPRNIHLPGVTMERKLSRRDKSMIRKAKKEAEKAEKLERKASKRAAAKAKKEQKEEQVVLPFSQTEVEDDTPDEEAAIWSASAEPVISEEPQVFPISTDFAAYVFQKFDDGTPASGIKLNTMLQYIGLLMDSVVEATVLEYYELHGYEVEPHLWDLLLRDIWKRKIERGFDFLSAQYDASFAGFQEQQRSSQSQEEPSGFDDASFDDDEDQAEERDTTEDQDRLSDGIAEAVEDEEEDEEEGGETVESEVPAGSRNDSDVSKVQTPQPSTAPLTEAERLMLRGGGGSTWKPESIIKQDGTEHKVDSNKYAGNTHTVKTPAHGGLFKSTTRGTMSDADHVGVIDNTAVSMVTVKLAQQNATKKVSEQALAGELTGVKTNVDAKAEAIVRTKKAQQLAFDAKRVNPNMRGADVRIGHEGAEFSHYAEDADRYAEPEGLIQFHEDGDERLVDQVVENPAFVHDGGASVFTKVAAEETLLSCESGTWLLRKDQNMLCMSWVLEGRVSHHFITCAGNNLKISLFPYAKGHHVIEGSTTVEDVLGALQVAQDFWPAPLGVYFVKGAKTVEVVRTRRTSESISIPSAVQHKQRITERAAREIENSQPLAFTKGARKQQNGDGRGQPERLVGHRALEVGSGAPPSQKPSRAAVRRTPLVYHRYGKFFHASCDKASSDKLLLANDGKALKENSKSGVYDGKFLVRPKGNNLILSVMFRGKPTHHNIEQSANGMYKINGKESKMTTVPDLLSYLESKRDELKWPVTLRPDISIVSPEAREAEKKSAQSSQDQQVEEQAEEKEVDASIDKSQRGGISADSQEFLLAKQRQELAKQSKAMYNPMSGSQPVEPRNKKEANAARLTAVMGIEAQRLRTNRDIQSSKGVDHTGHVIKDVGAVQGEVVSHNDVHPDDYILPQLHGSHGRIEAVQALIAEDTGVIPEGDVPPPPKAKFVVPELIAEAPPKIEAPRRKASATTEVGLDAIVEDVPNTSDTVNPENNESEEEDLAGLPFVFELLKASEAQSLLAEDSGLEVSGKFLLRTKAPMSNELTEFILSVVYKGRATHHQVSRKGVGEVYSINGADTPAKTLTDLVSFLGVKQKSVKWPVPLTQHVPKN